MDAETFLDHVQQRLGAPHRDEVVDVVQATLSIFGEQLSGGEAEDLAAQLDDEVAGYLLQHAGGQPDDLALEDFYEKVAARQPLSVGVDQARQQAIAVLGVLSRAVGDAELRKATSQLKGEYKELLAAAAQG